MSEATLYNSKEDKRMSHFVGIGLVLGFLLPHNSTMLLLVNPLLCLFYQCFKQNRIWNRDNLMVVIPLLITIVINLPQGVTTKALLSSMIILLYFFTFPMVGKVKIPNYYFYFILGFIFLSQLAYALDLSFFEMIMNTFYPISEEDKAMLYMQSHITTDNMMDFRVGGIYHNSNQCARYLSFILAAYFILNHDRAFKKLLPFVIVNYYAILMTGSRTGFVVASLIIIVRIIIDKRITSLWKAFVVFIVIVVFLVLIGSGSDIHRRFAVIQGFSDSVNLKMDTFSYYISSESSFIRLLFGYLDTSRFDISKSSIDVMNSFDSDYGNIIFSYGFIGFIAILFYFFTIFLKLRKEKRLYFILVLWMYSSTIVTSFRALFIFMLLLSIIYNSEKIDFVNTIYKQS